MVPEVRILCHYYRNGHIGVKVKFWRLQFTAGFYWGVTPVVAPPIYCLIYNGLPAKNFHGLGAYSKYG